jgi:hypothetical protein
MLQEKHITTAARLEGHSSFVKIGNPDDYKKDRTFSLENANLIFSRTVFSQLIREFSQDYNADMKFTKKALLQAQIFVEDRMIKLLQAAKKITWNLAAEQLAAVESIYEQIKNSLV